VRFGGPPPLLHRISWRQAFPPPPSKPPLSFRAHHVTHARASFASLAFVAVVLSSVARSSPARAEGEDADALFNAGRELMQQGRFTDACPKFAQSQRVIPAVGTALNLGLCLEKLGHTASAVAAYRDAITMASALGPTEVKRIAVARDRLLALEPRIVKMQIVVADDVAGLEVKRDGLGFAKSQYGTALPVDPIPHVIEATAPGRQPWRTTVVVSGDGAIAVVTVPPLAAIPKPVASPVPAAAPRSAEPTASDTHPVALTAVLGGVGLVALTAGVVLALDARSRYDDADSLCDARGCAPQAAALQDGARARGNVATVAFIAGGLALAGAAVVWFAVPGPRATSSGLAPSVGRVGLGPGGVALGGSF
jgi:hypothetical protein